MQRSDAPWEHDPASFRYFPCSHSRHKLPEHFIQKGETEEQSSNIQAEPLIV